jgi:hypothetical protein
MSSKRIIKKRIIKKRQNKKTQKGGYKYNDSSVLDSRSEEITTSTKNKRVLKTRKRSQNKSRK